jgi:phenylalanyl-tRNA synthetase beta chain
LPNLCRAVSGNLRYFDEFAIFEGAQVLWGDKLSADFDEREKLPTQRRYFAGAVVGGRENVGDLFRRTKGIIAMLPRYTHIEALNFVQAEKPDWADASVWLNIMHNETMVGNVALLCTKSALVCGIKNSAVMLFELDIDALVPLASRTNQFVHIPEHPVTDYDVSILVGRDLRWEQIEAVVKEKIGPDSFIRGVSFVDEYRGKQIPEDKKSVTLRLIVGANKTLTHEEIENSVNAVIKRLSKTVGAEMR